MIYIYDMIYDIYISVLLTFTLKWVIELVCDGFFQIYKFRANWPVYPDKNNDQQSSHDTI